MATVSEGQKLTRRRALGRRLIRKASDISVLCGDIQSQDLEYLTAAERKRFDKLIEHLSAVSKHFNDMGSKMDQP